MRRTMRKRKGEGVHFVARFGYMILFSFDVVLRSATRSLATHFAGNKSADRQQLLVRSARARERAEPRRREGCKEYPRGRDSGKLLAER